MFTYNFNINSRSFFVISLTKQKVRLLVIQNTWFCYGTMRKLDPWCIYRPVRTQSRAPPVDFVLINSWLWLVASNVIWRNYKSSLRMYTHSFCTQRERDLVEQWIHALVTYHLSRSYLNTAPMCFRFEITYENVRCTITCKRLEDLLDIFC